MKRCAWLFALLATASCLHAEEPGPLPTGWHIDSAGAFVHSASQAAFPPAFMGMIAMKPQVYDEHPENASLDYSSSDGGTLITVFVYPRSQGQRKPDAEFKSALEALKVRYSDAIVLDVDVDSAMRNLYSKAVTWGPDAERMGGWVMLAYSPKWYFKVRASCRMSAECVRNTTPQSLAILEGARNGSK
jgi:hypothetical protein